MLIIHWCTFILWRTALSQLKTTSCRKQHLLHAFKGYPQPMIDSLMWRYKRLLHLPQDGFNSVIPSVLQSSTVGANCSSFLLSSPPCADILLCCIFLPLPPFSGEHCPTKHLLQSPSQHCFYRTQPKIIYK